MKYGFPKLLLNTAILCSLALTPAVADESAKKPPRTISELFRQMGEGPAKENQLKLELGVEITGKDLGTLPKSIEIALFYDKEQSKVMVVSDSTYPDGKVTRSVTMSNKQRAATWSEPKSNALADKPDNSKLSVSPIKTTQTLPNPWAVPVKLAFPGLFTDALHGYQALSKEYSRAARLNREPDADGLVWFDMRPSKKSDDAIRKEFNEGLKVKAGFAAEGGWLKRLEVEFGQTEAVMKLKVKEQSAELSDAELAAIEIPERVIKKVAEMASKKPFNSEEEVAKRAKVYPPKPEPKNRGNRKD